MAQRQGRSPGRRPSLDAGRFSASPARSRTASPTPTLFSQERTAQESDGSTTQVYTLARAEPDGATRVEEHAIRKNAGGAVTEVRSTEKLVFTDSDYIREVEVVDREGYRYAQESTDPNWRPAGWSRSDGPVLPATTKFWQKENAPVSKPRGEQPWQMRPQQPIHFPEVWTFAPEMNDTLWRIERNMNYLDDWDTELVEDMLTEMEKNFCELRRLLNKSKPGTEPRLHLQISEVINYLRTDMMRRGKQRVIAMVPTLRSFVDLQITKYRSHHQFNPAMLGRLGAARGRGRGSVPQSPGFSAPGSPSLRAMGATPGSRPMSPGQRFSAPGSPNLRGSGLSIARMRPPMRGSPGPGSRPRSPSLPSRSPSPNRQGRPRTNSQ